MLLTLSGRSYIKIQYGSFPLVPVAYPSRIAKHYNFTSSARNIILRVTAYSGELLSPTSVTKTAYTGFWLVSGINRRKLATSSENSERVTSSVRSNSISYGHILNL